MKWRERAACQDFDEEWWFGADDEDADEFRERVELAKAICRQCPVISQCLDYALESREMHGIWGGKTEWERLAILAERGELLGDECQHLLCRNGHLRRPDTVYQGPNYTTCRVCKIIAWEKWTAEKDGTASEGIDAGMKRWQLPVETYHLQGSDGTSHSTSPESP
jgi:WhiB family redox-sensing transcriptional regulator